MTDDLRPESGFTLIELLVAVVITGAIAAVLGAAFIIGSKTTVQAGTRLRESHDAQLLTAYFRDDAASASYLSTTETLAGCSITDLASPTPVAMFDWTDWANPTATVRRNVYYVQVANQLVRRYCENGTKKYDLAVVKNLASGATPVQLTCPVACVGSPEQVQMTVTEASGYTYTVQSAKRTDTATALLGNVALYVSGNLDLKSQSTVTINNGAAAYIGTGSCANKAVVQSDITPAGTLPAAFYSSGGGCGATTTGPFADPLANLPVPSQPTTPVDPAATSGSSPCAGATTTYQPGWYKTIPLDTSGKSSTACLASGVYYLDKGAVLSNVKSAPGGVLIYVNNQGVSMSGSVTLAPMSATTSPDAGVTLFLRRDNTSTISIQASSADINIDGVLYGRDGSLSLQNNNAMLNLTGALDVGNLSMNGQGSKALGVTIS